jgi:small-conductance mechanosensitive channel
MQNSQPTSPRCPHCGADKFTFREVFGPATALEEHENQRAKISGLHQQLHEIGELIQQTSAGYAAQAEEAAAAAIVRRQQLSEKLSGHQTTRAQLIATRDRLLAPLRERAKQAAEFAFRQQVEKDPTVLLYSSRRPCLPPAGHPPTGESSCRSTTTGQSFRRRPTNCP